MDNQRNGSGQFAPGNTCGRGRPRRSVERDYLAALGDAVSLEDWQEVVSRAVTDAKQGDARARDWLSRHLIGEQTTVDVLHETAPQIILQVPGNGRLRT